jgi:hypothetical protein
MGRQQAIRKRVSVGERYTPRLAELERAVSALLPIAASLLAQEGNLQVLDERWVRDHVSIRSIQPGNGAGRE